MYTVKNERNVLLTTADFDYAESFAYNYFNAEHGFVEVKDENGNVLIEVSEAESVCIFE